MITLYQFPTSPFSEKVRRILNFKQVAFIVHDVPRARVAEYARVSPTGKFPAIDHDGTPVWDSTDIAHHLERAFPEPALIPASGPERGLVHALEDWADESLYFYEMTMRLAWEHNVGRVLPAFLATMPGLDEAQARTLITESVGKLTTTQGLGRKPRTQITEDAARHFRAIDDLLSGGDWLVGGRITLADIAVAAQVAALLYAEECMRIVADLPRVQAWIARVDTVAPA